MDMSESDEVATAVKRRRSCDGNLPHREGHQGQLLQRAALEVAELKYQHALRRLKQAYPEEFCGWGLKSAEHMAAWAVGLGDRGHPIAAAQQAAKALGLWRRDQAVCMPGCAYVQVVSESLSIYYHMYIYTSVPHACSIHCEVSCGLNPAL